MRARDCGLDDDGNREESSLAEQPEPQRVAFGNKDSDKPSNPKTAGVEGKQPRLERGAGCVVSPGPASLHYSEGGGRNTQEKLKSLGGLVVVEQAIPEGSVIGVWEVRGSVKGKKVQGMMERMEH